MSPLNKKFSSEKLVKRFDATLEISADKEREYAIKTLSAKINSMFTDDKISVGSDAIIASTRQNAELSRTYEMLSHAIFAYESGISTDAASTDIEGALGAIAQLDGKAISDEVVSDIFSKFCVGK